MAEDDTAVVQELRLMREQQWSMHRALVERIDQTNARLDQTNACLDQTNACLGQTNEKLGSMDQRLERVEGRLERVEGRLERVEARVESLAETTAEGFAQVVEHGNRLQSAFERFVELSLEDRRRLLPEIDQIKARLAALERKVH